MRGKFGLMMIEKDQMLMTVSLVRGLPLSACGLGRVGMQEWPSPAQPSPAQAFKPPWEVEGLLGEGRKH